MTQDMEVELSEDGLAQLREWAATERPETTDAVGALADEVELLRKRLGRVTYLAGHDVTFAIDGTRWIEARRVFAAATGNPERPAEHTGTVEELGRLQALVVDRERRLAGYGVLDPAALPVRAQADAEVSR